MGTGSAGGELWVVPGEVGVAAFTGSAGLVLQATVHAQASTPTRMPWHLTVYQPCGKQPKMSARPGLRRGVAVCYEHSCEVLRSQVGGYYGVVRVHICALVPLQV